MKTRTEAATDVAPWIGLSFVLLSFVFRLINAVVTTSELPVFQTEFGISSADAELTLTLFLAIAGALIVPIGMLADRYGRVTVFTYGTVTMIVANVITALSPNFTILLASRVLEAIAFPAMGVASLALVVGAFSDQRRKALAISFYGASYGLGLTLAVVLGGFFTTDVSWRWSFAMNVPVLIVALIGVRRSFTSKADRHPGRPIDWAGGIFLLGILTTLLIALDQGPTSGWDGLAGVLILACLIFAVTLVAQQRWAAGRGKPAIFDAQVMDTPGFRPAITVGFLMMFGGFAVVTVVPILWVLTQDSSPIQVGLGLSTLGIGWMAGALLSVRMGRRYGARKSVISGLILAAAGLAATALIGVPSESLVTTAPCLALLGIGMGIAYARINEAGLQRMPETHTSQGSGLLIGFRLIGGGLGSALLAQFLLLTATNAAEKAITSDAALSSAQQQELTQTIGAIGRGRYGSLFTDELKPTLESATVDIT
ncbi:MAG: MFS transporter, partial [Actinomycetia bacterium]|nr:MFS transporter [Actinomycetes bacterium]